MGEPLDWGRNSAPYVFAFGVVAVDMAHSATSTVAGRRPGRHVGRFVWETLAPLPQGREATLRPTCLYWCCCCWHGSLSHVNSVGAEQVLTAWPRSWRTVPSVYVESFSSSDSNRVAGTPQGESKADLQNTWIDCRKRSSSLGSISGFKLVQMSERITIGPIDAAVHKWGLGCEATRRSSTSCTRPQGWRSTRYVVQRPRGGP
jgi:hypothetical protein